MIDSALPSAALRVAAKPPLAIACAVLAACSFEHGAQPGRDGAMGSDARTVDSPFGAWSAPVDIGLSSGFGDDDPSLTNDLREIFWGSRRPSSGTAVKDEDVFTATRASATAPWGPPTPVAELNTTSAETTMKVTGDGLTIFLTSTRAGTYDIYMATRANRSQSWTTPTKVNELSTLAGNYAAFAQSNRLHVIWCAGSVVANEALYTSDRAATSAPWGTPKKLDELDEAGISECDPNEPNEFAVYYSTQHLTGDGTYDIYTASRSNVGDPYGSRTKVDTINLDGFNDRDPWLSPDERTMVFSSDRDGVTDRLYMTTR